MKSALIAVALLICLALPSCLHAQITDATVCDILANPESFDGKMVRVKGTVIAGFEEFSVRGSGCSQPLNAIWLSYPSGTSGKAGPAALVRLQLAKNHPSSLASISRTAVTLAKNDDFKNFDNLLSQQAKTKDICLGCEKFTVTATLVGRLDGSKDTGFIRDASGRVVGIGGFGHLNRYSARLVLQSVSDLSSQEIDYGKPGATASVASPNPSFGGPTLEQFKAAAAAFGGPGEHNGVIVSFSGANEIPKEETWKSATESPDGLVFVAVFDRDRTSGPVLQMAIRHLGNHIADIRNSNIAISNLSMYGAEFRAWQISSVGAAADKLKTLTVPGSYIIYNQSWSDADLSKNGNAAIAGFLSWASIMNLPKP